MGGEPASMPAYDFHREKPQADWKSARRQDVGPT
jgi:hypothetical protein